LRNGDVFEDHLATVARIHLFGHVHTSRIQLNRDFIRISASAAHPDREEHGWEPGYNLIDLETAGKTDNRKLIVKIYIRVWQNRPGQFHAKCDKTKDVFEYEISLDPWESAGTDSSGDTIGIEPNASLQAPLTENSMEKLRDISIRFFKLTASQRALIAGKLALVDAEDRDLPDFERTRRILLRAKERNLIVKLESELRNIGSAAV
jgi:hypothetical protein